MTMAETPSIDLSSLSLLIGDGKGDERTIIADSFWTFPDQEIFILEENIQLQIRRAGNDVPIADLRMTLGSKRQSFSSKPCSVRLYAPFPQHVVDSIEKKRGGQDLKSILSVNTITYLPIKSDNVGNRTIQTNVLAFHFYFTKNSEQKSYPAREWVENFLKKCGYSNRLFLELPIRFPSLNDPSKLQVAQLVELKESLEKAAAEIKNAQEEYLHCRNPNAVNDIRKASDGLKSFLFKEKDILARELRESTGTSSANVSTEIFESELT